ncbi:exodeoxyribonuclease V subunit alpha [Mycolicibacterium mengxianglii]|uniref:exodeoxyribonuclease V subunit alpha n=1 Tax=Mycolicibacterium mengxianglii TaxID=2736649 RepID=UPI0018D1BECD|nr:exodeoxyribonuclease V subunit alpha [Mycolicibacterium mengxianglii]
MTILAVEDPHDWRRVRAAPPLLRLFNDAGVLEAADVHVAARLAVLADETDETVMLAVALAVRGLRSGSVCVDLAGVADEIGLDLPWPEVAGWLAAVRASPLLGTPPVLRLYGDSLLYLDRYYREEEQVCADLLATRGEHVPVDDAALAAGLDRVFPAPKFVEQRAAAQIALSQWTTVLTGGPGTGKTTTVAGLLALLAEQAELAGRARPRIALAAPTGKASARLQQAVQAEIDHLGPVDRERLRGLQAVTLHRLLGARPDTSARFKHHRANRLPYDAIVVDETSMVPLTMMARLLESVRPATRLILVGDPDQLASVEAGAVLADLVDGLGARSDLRVAALHTSHRFGETISRLAEAIRLGDGDTVLELLRAGGEHIEYIDEQDPTSRLREVLVGHALDVRAAAMRGDAAGALAALDTHRLLCAHRDGPHGVRHWNRQIERWLTEETGEALWTSWYVGRPVLVTANDYGLRLYNGDTGVAVLDGSRDDGALRVAVGSATGTMDFATSRLADVETMHAMTIHKSQGSQAAEVTVLLPPEDSRLLTRELFYTAVTRAKAKVRVVGTEAGVRAALQRRVVRATGLRQRLSS